MRSDVVAGGRLPLAEQIAAAPGSGPCARFLSWIGETFDAAKYAMLQQQFADDPDQNVKYLNVPYWASHKFEQLNRIGCAVGDPRRRLLDLGCGPGHLMLAARYAGHSVVGLDIENPLYAALCAFFGVARVLHHIRPMQPLPHLGTFDRVTCTMVEFDKYPLWGVTEWRYFLDDVRSMLAPGGQIYVTLTSSPERSSAVWRYFEKVARWNSGHHAFLI